MDTKLKLFTLIGVVLTLFLVTSPTKIYAIPTAIPIPQCGLTAGSPCCQSGGSPYCLQNTGLNCRTSDMTCQPGPTNTPASSGTCDPNTVGGRCCDQDITGYWGRCNAGAGLVCTNQATRNAGTCVQCGTAGNPACFDLAGGGCTDGSTPYDRGGGWVWCRNVDAQCTQVSPVFAPCPPNTGRCSSGGVPTSFCCPSGLCPNFAPGRGPDLGGDCNYANQIETALGCISFEGKNTIQTVLNWGVGLAGGIAFLVAVLAAFQITSAQGDPKKVQAGKELLTAALAGMFLIALSVVILNFVGINVLGLGSLGFNL